MREYGDQREQKNYKDDRREYYDKDKDRIMKRSRSRSPVSDSRSIVVKDNKDKCRWDDPVKQFSEVITIITYTL